MGTKDTSFLEKRFKLSENKTTVRTEFLAGFTSFVTVAYILVVNPIILSDAGMDKDALFTTTILASIIGTLAMSLFANYPFVLAPGMGLNAFFAYSVVLNMGYSWQFALTAVFIEGLIFIVLTFLNVREAIIEAIPINIKHAVSVGIGLFIAFLGLRSAGIIVADPEGTLIKLGDVTEYGPLVTIIGLIITGVLVAKDIKGGLLIGIIASTIVGIPFDITPMPSKVIDLPPSIKPIAFQFVGFDQIFSWDMLIVLFTFLFVDLFDTIGTLLGVASKADMLDDDGNLPGAKPALFADAVGTTFGAVLGTSTVTTTVESAAGVAEGGRTGLTSLVTTVFFALALLFSPILTIIPAQATAPALIIVGLFMMSPITKIDLNDFTEAIPAFLTIIMMPLAFSIAEGLVFGMVSYVLLKVFTGRGREASPILYILSILFVLKYIGL
ncbi:NCS2 family permease [Dethiothermospora halolimnae]|uniref:NCS2 family permease n=1 Tax=Dethiothermospora halolimnae TaxID=3114390 RepID=UPI003CCBFA21